jgi:hypothetical protein
MREHSSFAPPGLHPFSNFTHGVTPWTAFLRRFAATDLPPDTMHARSLDSAREDSWLAAIRYLSALQAPPGFAIFLEAAT